MNYQVFRFLQREEAERVLALLADETFADGRSTAHGQARDVKKNLQTKREGKEFTEVDRIIVPALERHELFQAFALPKRIMQPMYNRYEPGMEYGAHVDNAFMGVGAKMRTDLSLTIFLNSPETYDGGELMLRLPVGEEPIKLDAGEAVVYPSSSIHRVAPVTRGVRNAAVTWVQSMVRDEYLRTILFDLSTASHEAGIHKQPELMLKLGKCFHNLLRYASEP